MSRETSSFEVLTSKEGLDIRSIFRRSNLARTHGIQESSVRVVVFEDAIHISRHHSNHNRYGSWQADFSFFYSIEPGTKQDAVDTAVRKIQEYLQE